MRRGRRVVAALGLLLLGVGTATSPRGIHDTAQLVPWVAVLVVGGCVAAFIALVRARERGRADEISQPRAPARRAARTAVLTTAATVGGVLVGVLAYTSFFAPGPISGDLGLVHSARPGLRVLFIGNSLTARNSMISMVRGLAQDDQHREQIFAVQYAPDGSTLEDALRDNRLKSLLRSARWNDVVLQENSHISPRPQLREALMTRAVAKLKALADGVGAKTVLFMTWGYRNGDHGNLPSDTYQAMQARVESAYLQTGLITQSEIAPVGLAWADAIRSVPTLALWSDDGIHPSRMGSYLAACTVYGLLTHRDPEISRFTAGLDPAVARWLQRDATQSIHQVAKFQPVA